MKYDVIVSNFVTNYVSCYTVCLMVSESIAKDNTCFVYGNVCLIDLL